MKFMLRKQFRVGSLLPAELATVSSTLDDHRADACGSSYLFWASQPIVHPVSPPWHCALGVAILVAFLGCSHPAPDPQRSVASDALSGKVPLSRGANDVARFLAGLPGDRGSPLLSFEKQPAWRLHQQELNDGWRSLETEWIPSVREFAQSELSGALRVQRPVFYPFSGPDALVVTTLFSHSPGYVMVGLEPSGTLPTTKDFAGRRLGSYLGKVRGTLSSELHRSFFVTREMDRQFRGQVSDGLLEPILILLVRNQNTVLGYRYVRLDDEGKIVDRNTAHRIPGHAANHGVEIEYQSNQDQSRHKLLYLSVNLADDHLGQNGSFLAFLDRLKGMTTYLKATSYMPHHTEFSVICKRVLENSSAILQDDSGIPYRYFGAEVWKRQLYGQYDRPYGSFRWLQQPDLKMAFETLQPKPLGFRMGYGFSRVPSNLLFATRRPRGGKGKDLERTDY